MTRAWRTVLGTGMMIGLLAMPAFIPATLTATLSAADSEEEQSPQATAAVKKGLAWLAANQRPDGSWQGVVGSSTGGVASCALAFLSNGHVPGSGEYGQVVSRSIEFIIRSAQPTGLLFKNGMGPGGIMYHHGLATLVLAEAWGQTADPRMRECLRKAVDLICASQNQHGGWRYQPKITDDDLSATVMQLMALRAAKDAGLEVPKDVIDAGIEYVKHCHNSRGQGKDGGFAYQPGGESGYARTGAGVTSLQVAGNYKATEVSEGVDYLMSFAPNGEKAHPKDGFYYYGMYYATMGIYQAQSIGQWGRKAWAQFYPATVKGLVADQRGDGHWEGDYELYPTAMAALILDIPCRYLPIYQR